MAGIVQVRKRDGSVALFNRQKIMIALSKAMDAVGELDLGEADRLCEIISEQCNKRYGGKIPDVEQIQDIVEDCLMRNGHTKVAKAYILYRHQRTQLREAKRALLHGKFDNEIELSLNALQILENRYLLRNEQGQVIETPSQLFKRVAHYIASADTGYGKDAQESEQGFYQLLARKEFLPATATLMNAGTAQGQLLSAYTIPIDDSLEGIFEAVKHAALIQQAGGGTGFSFSRLRPRRDKVKHVYSASSGPLAFMRIFELAIQTVRQGGKREGANMGVLRVDHPDIIEFINMKSDGVAMPNFNLSVGITDSFMRAVKAGTNYRLVNPRTGQPIASIPARVVFDTIVAMAWRKGDPGILFIDRINKKHACSHLGAIETTSPCGEMPLLPYESAAEGSINLMALIDDDHIFNWERLKQVVHKSVHFLDNVITLNTYPVGQAEQAGHQTRKIGLGVMGFADVLYRMGIKYDSDEGIVWGRKIMGFIHKESHLASEQLAYSRGVFPGWKGSKWEEQGKRLRNAGLTAILPTGTMSMVADVSAALEPNFALTYKRKALDGREFIFANEVLKTALQSKRLYSEALLRDIMNRGGTIQGMESIPRSIRDVFVTAQDIDPQWHIRMEVAFQEFCDGAVSKTINFPASATVKDVEESFLFAWDAGCKGITIYRDGSMDRQIIMFNQHAQPTKRNIQKRKKKARSR